MPFSSNRQTSALSLLAARGLIQPDKDDDGGILHEEPIFHPFKLTVYFGEYLNEEPIALHVTSPWTVSETIDHAIKKWNVERAICKLKGTNSNHYSMRCMDDDEIDDDIPAFGKQREIHSINETIVGLQFVGGADYTGPSSIEKQASVGVMGFKTEKEQMLIRVRIPGPNNESHVIAIDKDATALTVRDLISLLNKKKVFVYIYICYYYYM